MDFAFKKPGMLRVRVRSGANRVSSVAYDKETLNLELPDGYFSM